MNLDEIKNLIEKDGGKFIIVEDGRPVLTVMSFGDYKKIVEGYKNNPFDKADLIIEQDKKQEQDKEREREQEGLSQEGKNFLEIPIQEEDEEADIENLPV
ncbi:hypothetical protein KAW43_01405 [Candidatus Parcubacteria bacterium]|jgi:hypothetical protein|nr:hypothetical protein [Candidatus Parcubacteria bacterium]